ncbi:hypothetical protein PSH87_10690 [Pseudomonas sp. FP453]|nr:hypothetical protein [Pseudomonas sp. FP453]WLH93058.1 hypothetical protein PSH87_10690 [Pseudomonas sp. FP453]
MQTPRYIRNTQLMPSQASQLPQVFALDLHHWIKNQSAATLKPTGICPVELGLKCGSWLACDAGNSVHQAHPVDAIAGKPAPQVFALDLHHWIKNQIAATLKPTGICPVELGSKCGSWLACDAGNSVHQTYPVDAIAGKPAPTGERVSSRDPVGY